MKQIITHSRQQHSYIKFYFNILMLDSHSDSVDGICVGSDCSPLNEYGSILVLVDETRGASLTTHKMNDPPRGIAQKTPSNEGGGAENQKLTGETPEDIS